MLFTWIREFFFSSSLFKESKYISKSFGSFWSSSKFCLLIKESELVDVIKELRFLDQNLKTWGSIMIITRHKRDVNVFVLQLGAALAISFAGLLFSRFKKQTKRIGPTLPTLRPQSPGLHLCLIAFFIMWLYSIYQFLGGVLKIFRSRIQRKL